MKKYLWLLPALLLFLFPTLLSLPPFKGIFISAVERKTKAEVEIDWIRFSWFGPQVYQNIHFKTPELEGTIQKLVSRTPIWNLSSLHSFSLENGQCQIQEPLGSIEQLQAEVRGPAIDISGQTTEQNQTGDFHIQGTLSNLSILATHMPSLLLDRLLHANGYVATALGPEFSIKGQSSLQDDKGLLELRLLSAQADMSLRASYTPFSTFSLSDLNIDSATLDLGRFPLPSSPSVGSIFSLLKTRGPGQTVSAWFTPIDFTLQKGVLRLDRFDLLLANSIHVCAWGSIDLARDRLQIQLGVPSDALTKAFGIPFPTRFALIIPIRGSLESPQFDTAPSTAKIAAILATQQIPKAGGLLGLFGAVAIDETVDIPPPKYYPFPWGR
ncbi:MAG: hypothetical protein KGJ02_05835 [Verrucomicrobiota bacterium]|nr:hypothetical protein [Verrucomicrobiota bacterium]